MQTPLWQHSATALAAAIRARKVSTREVIQAHIDRIQAVNGHVNAITVVLTEEALRSADAADRKVNAGEKIGPLHGVPMTVKESIDVAGSATTCGLAKYKDAIAVSDAPVINYLREAGAIPLARTNVPDWGLRWHTANDLRGATLNPWDPRVTPGGSSGGEAAAIATGMSPLGVGNDMGGSIRYPAQCCGIAGLKPSLGRISRTRSSIVEYDPLFYEQIAAVNGPMARTVADLRLALSVMGRCDAGDPLWVPAPRAEAAYAKTVRVALTVDPGGFGVSQTVEAGVRAAADSLASAGYLVKEVEPPALDESTPLIQRISDMELGDSLANMLSVMSDDGGTVLRRIVGNTEPDLGMYMRAIATRHRIATDWSLFMTRYPLVLGPVSTLPPFPVGFDVEGQEQLDRFIRSIVLTEVCNLLGLPSVAVPIRVSSGLPQAVQVIGQRFHEDLCFDAAEVIERQAGPLTPIDPSGVRAEISPV